LVVHEQKLGQRDISFGTLHMQQILLLSTK